MVGLHVFSLLGDTYYKYTITQLLVPFTAIYRPGWTALGLSGSTAADCDLQLLYP